MSVVSIDTTHHMGCSRGSTHRFVFSSVTALTAVVSPPQLDDSIEAHNPDAFIVVYSVTDADSVQYADHLLQVTSDRLTLEVFHM